MSSHSARLICALAWFVTMSVPGSSSAGTQPDESVADTAPEPTAETVEPVAPGSPEEIRDARARVLYDAELYADAARAYEALWLDYKAAKYLYNLAVAHEVLGHDAHAYVHFRRYMAAADRVADNAAVVYERLQALKARTRVLRIQFPPETDLSATSIKIHYRSFHSLTDPARPPLLLQAADLERTDRPGELLIYAEPGLWSIDAKRPGVKNEHREVELREQEPESGVEFEPEPAAPVKPAPVRNCPAPPVVDKTERDDEARSIRRLSGTLGVVSIASLAGGTALLAYTGNSWNERLDDVLRGSAESGAPGAKPRELKRAFDTMYRDWLFESVGAGVMGGGAGLGVASIIGRHPRRPSAWIAPLLIGGAAAAGGLAGAAVYNGDFDERSDGLAANGIEAFSMEKDPRERYQQLRLGLVLTSAGAGVGAGLFVGSLVGMIHSATRRSSSRRSFSVQPRFDASGASLWIRGRF